MKNKNIEIAYSTPYKRTQQTLQPLITAENIDLNEYNNVGRLVDEVKMSKKNTIIAGHSNTILEITKKFGGSVPINEIKEEEYFYLIKLKIKEKKVVSKLKKYYHK